MSTEIKGYAYVYVSDNSEEEYLVVQPSDGDAGQLPGLGTVQGDQPIPGTNPDGRKRGRGDLGCKQATDEYFAAEEEATILAECQI